MVILSSGDNKGWNVRSSWDSHETVSFYYFNFQEQPPPQHFEAGLPIPIVKISGPEVVISISSPSSSFDFVEVQYYNTVYHQFFFVITMCFARFWRPENAKKNGNSRISTRKFTKIFDFIFYFVYFWHNVVPTICRAEVFNIQIVKIIAF